MTLDRLIEAVLFATAKPQSIKKLAEILDADPADVKSALDALSTRLDESGSGLMLARNGHDAELVTRPEFAEIVSKVVRSEAAGELTRASLEALTILAYRGPLTRPELEQIRGVQSALILRNLMLRGLVEETEDTRLGQPAYAVTFDLLQRLGLGSVKELPDYDSLHANATVQDMLKQLEEPVSPPAANLDV